MTNKRPPRPDAATVSALLAERIESLVAQLVGEEPTFTKGDTNRYYPKGGLVVVMRGARRGVWCNHGAGAKGGDALDLVRHLRGGTMREAWEWALAWLGLSEDAQPPKPAPRPAPAPVPHSSTADTARRLWCEAVDPCGSVVVSYLASRAGAPWATTARAGSGPAEGCAPGDTYTFTGGQTFAGVLSISNCTGTFGNPVIYTTPAGNAATITISAASSDGIDVLDSPYFTLSNFKVVGPGVSAAGTYTSTVGTLGVNIISDQTGTGRTFFNDVWIDNLDVSQFYDGIAITAQQGSAPYVATSSTTGVTKGFANLRLTNSTVHEVIGHGIASLPSSTGAGTGPTGTFPGMLWSRNVAFNVYGGGGVANNSNQTGQGMVMRGASYGVLQNSVVHDSNQKPTGAGAAGIWTTRSDNTVMQDSEVYNMGIGATCTADCSGFDIDGGNILNVGRRLYSHDNNGAGFMIGDYTGATTQNSRFEYSISQNDAQQDEGVLYMFGSTGTLFDHMTIYSAANSNGHAPTMLFDNTGGSATGKVVNSVFYQAKGAVLFNSGQTTSLSFLNNDYFSPDGQAFAWRGTNYASLAAFRAGTSNETLNGINFGLNADPKYYSQLPTAATVGNPPGVSNSSFYYPNTFNIQPNSPLYRAGVEPTTYLGVTGSVGALDFHRSQARRTDGLDIGAVAVQDGGYLFVRNGVYQ